MKQIVVCTLGGAVVVGLLLCAAAPLSIGMRHLGVFSLLGMAVVVAVNLWFYMHPTYLPVVAKYCKWLLFAIVVFEVVTSSAMLYAMYNTTPSTPNQTAVVLGCAAPYDKPSLTLTRRLQAVLPLLQANPTMSVVTTGGIGDNATISEAEVQRDWLVAHGIAPTRIFLEKTSHDTQTNLKNARNIIKIEGLSEEVFVVTDGFHQLRGQAYAKAAGLQPLGTPAQSVVWLLPAYWVREQLAIVEMIGILAIS